MAWNNFTFSKTHCSQNQAISHEGEFSICGAEINSSECSLGINNLSCYQQLFQVIQICNCYIALAGK